MKILKVIKIGGNIINDTKKLLPFLEKFASLQGPKILVHGGGKLATSLAQQLNIEVKMYQGRRITDADTLDIITMTYAGKINKNIVALLQAHQCNAIGLSGADGNTIIATKRPITEIDFGYVGDVSQVNTRTLELLIKNNITPVFCAITHDTQRQLLNTNADTIASALAIAFSNKYKVELYYCFEKKGVLQSIEDEDSVIQTIDQNNYKTLIDQGIITEGMIPKIDNCFYALNHNVHSVSIGLSDMLFTTNTIYTSIQK
ncbi:acetylglutamate kinase [uncultured Dokdonia sp.]|uniref:acetylglutamate kinase n=1 Tax=uncultured Dokdonia sp. TaxID=575653 RepID=UPI0026326F57|nr:acetylglutamate kinase [uncultured Dokdonia sp.]